MPLPDDVLHALQAAQVAVTPDAPLARRTWWRVGGPADGYARLSTMAELVAVQRVAGDAELPVFVLGAGSNLLVSDAGVRGLVVQLAGELAAIEADAASPPVVTAGAGARLTVLLARARRTGWGGLQVFAGIPGTVGGAVRMNAGATLGETVDVLESITLVERGGEVVDRPAEALRMSYRTSHLPPGAIVARARLRTVADELARWEAMDAFLARRKATQPLDKPSCGSTFRNPAGDHAGRLIEAAGLKGYTRGGAQVSEKHANFVVNLGSATAADLRAVIEHVQAEVHRQFGVELQREVHFVGDWSDGTAGDEAGA